MTENKKFNLFSVYALTNYTEAEKAELESLLTKEYVPYFFSENGKVMYCYNVYYKFLRGHILRTDRYDKHVVVALMCENSHRCWANTPWLYDNQYLFNVVDADDKKHPFTDTVYDMSVYTDFSVNGVVIPMGKFHEIDSEIEAKKAFIMEKTTRYFHPSPFSANALYARYNRRCLYTDYIDKIDPKRLVRSALIIESPKCKK